MKRSSSQRKKAIEEYKNSFFALTHIGGRVIYSIVAWFVIALDVSPTSFFVSLFLFILPVAMDCTESLWKNVSIRSVIYTEFIVCAIWASFAILGLFSIFIVVPIDNVLYITTSGTFIGFTLPAISVSRVWQLLGSVVFFAVVDLMCRQRQQKG